MTAIFTRLLLATEHTEYDSGAEPLALALAQKCAVPLAIVLPLVSNPEYEALAPQLAQRAEAEAAAKLQELRQTAQAAGVAVELRARRGPEPYREIVDEASERGSDLIVIRRRGQRGLLANLLVGEMVRNVVAHAPCSVLVTPRGARMWSRRVLVAIDPRSTDMTPVTTAAAIAAACALPLSVVGVADTAADAMQQAEKALQRAWSTARAFGIPVDGFVRIGRPHSQILSAAQQSLADLLVIGRHGDDTLARAWLGGVAQKVIGLADLPVLVSVTPKSVEAPRP
jgi:nucleotide-binding universal stress UspA family protein